MDDLVAWLRARLDEDELWAKAASAPYHGDGPTVPGGVHWTWAVGPNWEHVAVDPTASYVGEPDDTGDVCLVTVEEFPMSYGGPLPGNVLDCDGDEVRTGDAGHIVRHDPARVLREVEAKRWIVGEHRPDGADPCDAHDASMRSSPCETLRWLALPYSDRPGYQEEWKP